MEETEVPLESIHEEIHHEASHSKDRWVLQVALSSAFLAALAALAALMSGHHSNEAMLDQIQASDIWNQYQAKSIKAAILETRIKILEAQKFPTSETDTEKLHSYKEEQTELAQQAKEKEQGSREHLHTHQTAARSVTFFQIAITLAAIAVLTHRRRFWFLSLAFGCVGLVFLGMTLL